jgi:hypothetical protein
MSGRGSRVEGRVAGVERVREKGEEERVRRREKRKRTRLLSRRRHLGQTRGARRARRVEAHGAEGAGGAGGEAGEHFALLVGCGVLGELVWMERRGEASGDAGERASV